MNNFFSNLSEDDVSNFLVNLNKMLLNSKAHIKKYNRIRKLHSDVINSMENYILDGKYDISESYNNIYNDIRNELGKFKLNLDFYNADDITILIDLCVYKNYSSVKSLTEIYIENNKFRNADKIKMLKCMNESFASLFKVVDTDSKEGFVTYEDVFTKKQYKVIDISLSSSYKVDPKKDVYFYNRIITFDDISYGTGIHCFMSSKNKDLMQILKSHKYDNYSSFSKCVLLYDLSKRDKSFKVNFNNKY